MALIDFLNSNFNTDFVDNRELPFTITKKRFQKGAVITKYGQIEKHGYFIIDGLVQAEVQNKKFEQKILDFIFPNDFVCAYMSYLTQMPSTVRVSTVTDCYVEVVSRDEIYKLSESSLFLNKLGKSISEIQFLKKTQREINFLTKSSQELYLDLINSHPKIAEKIPLKRIAMYLGVQPETLSRIRKHLVS